MKYLKKEDILAINLTQTSLKGFRVDPYTNVLNMNSFLFIIDYVKSDRFQSVFDKAAQYAFFIINDHVFADGSKRTGMQCGLHFLELNGHITKEMNEEEIKEFALKIECKAVSRSDIAEWYKKLV